MAERSLREQAESVRAAARVLAETPDAVRREALRAAAAATRAAAGAILEANRADLAEYGEDRPGRDRLALDERRLEAMAVSLEAVAELADPLAEVVTHPDRPNGLKVSQRRVPLGVVGVIYENRPNVTTDVAGLCVRSGNAAFLRGSASARRTNDVLVGAWQRALVQVGLPSAAVSLVGDTSHETAAEFMGLEGYIDCLIPRGGPSLIAAMRQHARVPYVLDGDGNCHVYVDDPCDLEMAAAIIVNAKTSRPGVCNAAETLLVHAGVAGEILPRLAGLLEGVELRADARALVMLPTARAATEADFATEFLDLILAVGVVDSFEDAIGHVARYSSGHSEAIVTSSEEHAAEWVRRVDAAAVLVNASTRFVDGGELGLGCEVGISTQKLHARGPMGLRELTCLKWVIEGRGQTR